MADLKKKKKKNPKKKKKKIKKKKILEKKKKKKKKKITEEKAPEISSSLTYVGAALAAPRTLNPTLQETCTRLTTITRCATGVGAGCTTHGLRWG